MKTTLCFSIRFTLSKNGDVSWKIPDKLKCIPLFQCETYEYHVTTSGLKNVTYVDICFGAYVGQIFEFRIYNIKPKKRIILSGDDLCEMDCRHVDEPLNSNRYSAPYSLLPALEEGYFSDATITAKNKRQFKVHKTVLSLQGAGINWDSDPPPFSHLSEDTLGTILYFLYAECLPEDLSESTAKEIIKAVSDYKCLEKLVQSCQKYLDRTALRDDILRLLNDMHVGMDKIADYISPSAVEYSSKQNACWANPATLYNAIKHCFREEFVVIAKFIQFCDIFANKEHNLSNEEQDEILHVLKYKVPIYKQQFRKFLKGLKKIYRSMTTAQRVEMATFIVPEIEPALSMVITLLEDIDVIIQQIIQKQSETNSDIYLKYDDQITYMTKATSSNELKCLIAVRENVKMLLEALILRREQYTLRTTQEQVHVIGRILDFFVKEELPVFLIRLDEIVDVFDEKLELNEFKFFFKVETSKVTYVLEKLREQIDCVQSIISKICDLVQHDNFTQTIQCLGLMPTVKDTIPESSGNDTKPVFNGSSQGFRELNLIKSLCIPPRVQDSLLSKNSVELFVNQTDTDMEFEVIGDTKEPSGDGEIPSATERQIFKAHRVIVAARCDWFRRALLSGMKEAINKKIEIHDTNPTIFKLFLEYLYGGNLQKKDLSMEQLLELLLLSDRYEMDTLKNTCEYFLKSSIETDTALYLLGVADQYNANILKRRCIRYIADHNELTENEEFYDLPLPLQSEIFDIIWTRPKTPPDSDHDYVAEIVYSSIFNKSSSSSDDHDGHLTPRLESQVSQLRAILGDAPSNACLVQLILAADYNLERAVNFYYSVPSNSKGHS
ncbi:uncharacterized protein LOC143191312 isoform X3 [Rhynchophorus ferrugineus]|uniref:uncharacterized protein LOC143191312 isoform X3 n=1 Tax=Rhynchophorus ferrugineus TaxID=354439 RepID=UPI003FCCC1A9